MSCLILFSLVSFASARVLQRGADLGKRASQSFSSIFAFGDSYSTIHFSISGKQPNATNPIGNPAWPGLTTDGTGNLNYIGNLVAVYNQSLTLAYDFAQEGATIDNTIVSAYLSTIKSFSEQVDEFSQYYVTKPRATWYSNSTLFVSWFGINDIQNGYSPGNWSIVGPELVNRYFELVESLYSLGARNFVFLEVPPIWLTPALLAQNATEQVNKRSAVDDYNSLIQAAAHSFHVAKTDATVWLVNTAQPFETALDDPEAFGAPDATCYNSNGISCFWWNDFHPGAAIHKLVAEAISVKTGI